MSTPNFQSSLPWALLAIIVVDPTRKVQCQCKGCGHGIYAAIHMVQLPDEEIQCWGSDCYAREAGLAGVSVMKPLYSGAGGHKLTDQEREWLDNNRIRLITEFKAQHDELLRRQEEALRQATEFKAQHDESLRRQEEIQRQATEELRRRRESLHLSPPAICDVKPVTPNRSVYDRPPRKCVFCGQITTEWWTNMGADGCKCNACLKDDIS